VIIYCETVVEIIHRCYGTKKKQVIENFVIKNFNECIIELGKIYGIAKVSEEQKK